jgi:hypothetical protein
MAFIKHILQINILSITQYNRELPTALRILTIGGHFQLKREKKKGKIGAYNIL